MRKTAFLILLLAGLPLVLENSFYLSFASRVLIYALAATSLNLVLGYGGMVAFGHAAFLGAGAYVASICLAEGLASAWIGWPAAIVVSALAALAIGALSLRTRGVYFIMITLAFAQMAFYLVNSMKAYGGDEGLSLPSRATLDLGPGLSLNLADDATFYYTVLALLGLALLGLHRLVDARFGRALVAIRENEARAEALGFPTFRIKLAAFVIAGGVAGLAGALLASHGKYVNPNVLHWTQSGQLLIMVILGGVGHFWGGVLGAAALLILEHVISEVRIDWLAAMAPNYQQHAALGVGIVLLAVVLLAPQGIAGIAAQLRRGKPRAGGKSHA